MDHHEKSKICVINIKSTHDFILLYLFDGNTIEYNTS